MLLLILISSICFSQETSVVGEKVILKESKSYHFSDPKMASVHVDKKPAFFIGLQPGLINYEYGRIKVRHFILSKEQKQFFHKTDFLVSKSFLQWDMEDSSLTISGSAIQDSLYNYLFAECKRANARIILKIETKNPSDEIHPCLGHLPKKPDVEVRLMLINKARLSNRGLGLGAPSSVPWILTPEGQLKVEEVFGEISATRSSEDSKGEMIFEGLISTDQPLKFTNGLEVGVQPRSIISQSGVDWKSITSSISLDLIKYNNKEALINVNFKKMSRTGETNVFKTESFNRSNQVRLKKWVKLLTYIETTDDKKKISLLGVFLLGKNSSSKTSQQKELWLRLQEL